MAITHSHDFVFAPAVQVVMDPACFIGTKDWLCVIPDAVEVDRGWVASVLTPDQQQLESMSIDGKAPRQYLLALTQDPSTTPQSLRAFVGGLAQQWSAVTFVEIANLAKLKVKAGWLGGSIIVKLQGNMGFTPLVTSIPKPERNLIKAFYEDVMTRVNG
jgi:hypothetical protein